jgi:hypothetical protein
MRFIYDLQNQRLDDIVTPNVNRQFMENTRMASTQTPVNIAILDDYQNVALKFADWSRLQDRSQVTVFNDHVSDPAALVERLKPFEVISVMRERTPLPRSITEQLPNLKLIASNAPRNASIDLAAAKEYGITYPTSKNAVGPITPNRRVKECATEFGK